MPDSLAAVVAHGLLNSLAVVQGVTTLGKAWDGLTDDQRSEVTEMALSQAELMADGLDALPSPVKHRLANHLFVVRGACQTLMLEGRHMGRDDRGHLLSVIDRQTALAASVLYDVVRGLPLEVREVLDQLDSDRNSNNSEAVG